MEGTHLDPDALLADRTAGLALQRSLVPERLPDIPGLQLAGRYSPAQDGGVGGDWYDLFAVPSGHVFVIIGDVVGRGLKAAVVMGRLRSTVRAYALDVLDPAEVVARVDRKLQHFEPLEMATLLVAVLDPALDRVRVSLAGHPAPVLARPDQPACFLDLPVDPPLGVTRDVRRRSSPIDLEPGATLCFFTDGLVERRAVPLDERLDLLREAVTAIAPDLVCRTVMSRLVGAEPTDDDAALLVLRRLATDERSDLDLEVPALPASLSGVRQALRRWLQGTVAGPDDVADLLVAVGEACSNVVEHAYGPAQGTLRVRCRSEPGNMVAVTVRDTGSWRASRGANRGRGLSLIEKTTDEVVVDGSEAGTEVRLRRRIGPR